MSEKPVVVSNYRFSPESRQILDEAAGSEIIQAFTKQDLETYLPRAEVLCMFDIPKNWRQKASALRWLQFPGAGVDSLGGTGLLDEGSGIKITTAAGIHAINISEYVFGSMLMFNRSWPEMVNLQDQHIWPQSASWYNLRAWELAGKTLGVVGLGSIGNRIAKLGQAFEMRVVGVRYSDRQHEEDAEIEMYSLDRLHEMLSLCDYVVLSMPLTPQTEGMIGEPELRAMRKNAYLVNIARGKVIQEAYLVQALREGWIAGAGLDVVETEPLPVDSPLYTLPNVILTPHISGSSVHYGERLAALFADNLRRYRAGQPLKNLFDPTRHY